MSQFVKGIIVRLVAATSAAAVAVASLAAMFEPDRDIANASLHYSGGLSSDNTAAARPIASRVLGVGAVSQNAAPPGGTLAQGLS